MQGHFSPYIYLPLPNTDPRDSCCNVVESGIDVVHSMISTGHALVLPQASTNNNHDFERASLVLPHLSPSGVAMAGCVSKGFHAAAILVLSQKSSIAHSLCTQLKIREIEDHSFRNGATALVHAASVGDSSLVEVGSRVICR